MKTMKKLLLTIIAIAFTFFCFSQQVSSHVVSSGGNYSTAPGISISSTIGEPMVNTLMAMGFILTQGFQQPSFRTGLPGCTDSLACNYDSLATIDDGSCTYPGCTDPNAMNYDSTAGCLDSTACVYTPTTIANLYFSEYAEGSSNNKYFEVYNASNDTVDLTRCIK
tara:strand:- start:7 stop:504 length:498 start_codon:yes stop_codon:yes gene_type:complete